MQTIQVQVTAEHIAKGEPFNCGGCPIALSVAEMVPENVFVHADRLHIVFGGEDIVDTPVIAREFMEDFDAGKPVAPVTFPLEIPDSVQLAAAVGRGEVVDG